MEKIQYNDKLKLILEFLMDTKELNVEYRTLTKKNKIEKFNTWINLWEQSRADKHFC